MKGQRYFRIAVVLVLALTSLWSCKRASIEEPSPFGPSSLSIILDISADPNVLFAGSKRESCLVTATLTQYNGTPVSNETIQFHVRDSAGNRIAVGYFQGNASVATRVTNQNGQVQIRYYGPLSGELLADDKVFITALVAWQGKQFISNQAPVYIVRDNTDVIFTLTADPNILYCGGSRPRSLIKAWFTKSDGTPLQGRKVLLRIMSGPGNFSNGGTQVTLTVNNQGTVSIYYIAPPGSAIGSNTTVVIRGQPQTSSPFDIQEEVQITLVKVGN